MKSTLTLWLINRLERLNEDKKISKSGHEWLSSEIRCLQNQKTAQGQEYNPFFFLWNLEHLIDDQVHLTTYDLKSLIGITSRLILQTYDYMDEALWNNKKN